MSVIEDLKREIHQKKVILFVGAGVSKNIGLPLFSELIDEVARRSNYDPAIFKTLSNYQSLVEYYQIKRKGIGDLRSFMDVEWHKQDVSVLDNTSIYKDIVNLQFPIIYTTNYDNWLERAYEHYGKPYVKIAGVKDFVNIKNDATQIVKFHGDFSDDNSIVLTESSYFERLDFSSPLDIKLRSDMLGMTILYIGYSLEDINMRFLLYKLSKIWEAHKDIRPASYIFLTKPNEVEETILRSRGVIPIVSKDDNPGKGLSDFLGELNK